MSDLMTHDVLILGGGLAGLTLALQLRRRFADLDIRVVERRRHPLPVAAHKVGESTVEIGAHYLADTVGLRDHLDAAHIRKFGFRFFFSEGRADLDQVPELGVRRVFPTPTWQIDRGILENTLGERVRAAGIAFDDGCTVRRIDAGEGDAPHTVQIERDGARETVRARWLVDASGRAGLLKRQFGLAEANAHDVNAVWFRIDDKLAIDDWCGSDDWRGQCEPPERWRSTNHLCGPGYWAWLIPLGSGAHSVGIVCDARMHPLEGMNTFERALDWLAVHQPVLARECASRRDKLLDFLFLRNFSYGCRQVFSADRWALTGEAGVFLDPFYSPGTDFIGIANTYVTELIAHDRAGQPLAPYANIYQQLYFSFYENTLSLYRDQYPLFGDAQVMMAKVIWDYTYYWGILCQLVMQQRLTDLALFGDLRDLFAEANTLNASMQAFLRRWSEAGAGGSAPHLHSQGDLDWFLRMNIGLHDRLDDAGVRARLREHVERLRSLAATIVAQARADCPALDPGDLPCQATLPTPLFAVAA